MQAASLVLTSYSQSLGRAMDVVANNIANMNTTGYKRQDVQFETLVSRPAPSEKINFGIDRGTIRNTAAGPSITTGNPFDFSIQGNGYFQVETKNGTHYTRAGAFMLNDQGEIVTGNGEKLLGDGDQPITIPSDAEDILVSADGVISAKSGTGTTAIQLGKLKLVRFENEQALVPVGSNQYSSTTAPTPDTESRIVQGTIEQSNVSGVHEITRMINISRTYQQAMRLLDMENQRQNDAIKRLARSS